MNKRRLCAVVCIALMTTCRPATHPPEPAPSAPAIRESAAATPVAIVPPALVREFRGVWVSPVWRPDWPSRPGLTPDSQRAELRTLLDRAKAIGLNAIVLHVRTTADALYPTANAPWSAYLSGERGRAPYPAYDPLAFAVAEAHQRGLELHAWFNPFRAAPAGQKNPRIEHPEWVVSYATQKWIDPGIPEARRTVLATILEVVDRYDIDGVHLDDYFYPYLEKDANGRTLTFPDDASWTKFGVPAGFGSRPDWRRANINSFVETLYREVKAHKAWVSVGISPFGIWRPDFPTGITGLNAYSEIFADSRLWLRQGWLDYVVPQLYWPLDGAQRRFARLDEWWRGQNVLGRHVWPGLHTERETITASRWPAGEIERQIDALRVARAGSNESAGHIHFRLKALSPLADLLPAVTYAEPALTPSMPWLDARAPAPPIVNVAQGLLLRAQARDTVPVRWFAVQTLGSDGRWSFSLQPADQNAAALRADYRGARAIAVRAISPTGMASTPTVVVADK